MSVQGVTNSYGAVVGAAPNSVTDLNKVDFMNLLIAQIKHQDPMSPMDNQQFIAQLTQFTSLEELQKVNASLADNMALSQSLNNTMMVGLVGKRVAVAGSSVELADGRVSENKLQSAADGTARVEVRDAANHLIATYTRPVAAGLNDITWDGKTTEGDLAPDGQYKLEVSVQNTEGVDVPYLTFMTGTVESIRFENNLAIVSVGGEEFYVSEIMSVSL